VWEREQLLPLAHTDPEGLIDIILALQEQIQLLQQQVQTLREEVNGYHKRIEELEARSKLNSSNSSKPPSSDGYEKPRPKSLRVKSERPPGGQPGHPGSTLRFVDNPDDFVMHELDGLCPCGCGSDLRDEPVIRYEKRQVFDLPPQKLAVTEHQIEVKRCPISGCEVSASFPEDVHAPVQYGPRFNAWLVYERGQQLMPLERISQMSADLFGAPMSEATIEAACAHTYDRLSAFEDQVVESILRSPVVHADETGLRAEGKLQWLHVVSTPLWTWYGVHAKRGGDAITHFNLLPRFAERLIHDCWSPYFKLGCSHGLCNAHLLRELKYVHEVHLQEWAKQMVDLLAGMYRSVEAARADGAVITAIECASWVEAYRTVLQEGFAANPLSSPVGPKRRGRPKRTKAQNLLARLEEHESSVLAFLHDPRVPFTNNQAEQDVRMMKVQQKISGGFRTIRGAQVFARIRSYVSTARKNGRNVFEDLTAAVQGQPFIPACGP